MSWAEVKKINGNMSLSLDEKLNNWLKYPAKLFTASGTFTVPATGKYRIIAIGPGGNGGNSYAHSSDGHMVVTGSGGGAGGIGVLIANLTAGNNHAVTVGATVSFGSLVTATAGSNGSESSTSAPAGGSGGSASGTGVVVYAGNAGGAGVVGSTVPGDYTGGAGGSVGLYEVPALSFGGTGNPDGGIGYGGRPGSNTSDTYSGGAGGSFGGGGAGGGGYSHSTGATTSGGGAAGAGAVIVEYLG